MFKWNCPRCGFYTNSEEMKRLHTHEAKHECDARIKELETLRNQDGEVIDENTEVPNEAEVEELTVDDMTKKEIMAELDKKEIEYNSKDLKAELFDLLVGD